LIDFFSLFKGLFVVLAVFGVVMFFELLFFFQCIKYYKTGELIVGTRSQDIFWKEDKTGDFIGAIFFLGMGIGIFVSFNIALFLVEGVAGIILPILHGVIISTLVYWYWKKKTIEANQKEDVQST